MELKTYDVNSEITSQIVDVEKLDKEIKDSGYVQDYEGIVFFGEDVIVYGASILDETSLDSLMLNHELTVLDLTLRGIKDAYKKYENDGIIYFEEIRSKLVYDYKQGNKTESDIYQIENILDPVILKITRGDWMTAKNEINSIVVAPPLDQSLYDEIFNYINNYIEENY